MKITIRDKVILVTFLLICACYCFYRFAVIPTNNEISGLKTEKSQLHSFSTDVTPLMEQSKKLTKEKEGLMKKVENVHSVSGGYTATNEEFLMYLGDVTLKNNVDVIGFNELGTENINGVYTSNFDFELKGSPKNINEVLNKIDGMEIKYSIGSVSYRQNEAYNYLKRFYDNITNFSWYKEPEEEDIIANNENTDDTLEEETEDYTDIYVPDFPQYTPPTQVEEINPTQKPKEEPEETIEPEVTEKPIITDEPESINDRINNLLQNISNINGRKYYATYLSKNDTEYVGQSEMRLAITIRLIMFNEPSDTTSFYVHEKEDEDGIL